MRQRIVRATASMAQTVVAVILGMILTIGILIMISDDPTHEQLMERQAQIMDNQRIVLCLMLYPEDERQTPEILASCQNGDES
jgi:hypothetical protein